MKKTPQKLVAIMADTVPIVVEIFNEVKELYKTAQHNKNTTKILIERISVAFSVVSALQDDDLSSKYDTSLQRLVEVLQEMEEYIEDITQYNSVQKFLKDKIIEKKFKDLRKEYDTSISLLNSVDFKKFNIQEEDKVLRE